jgi:hypothetical protein
MDSNQACRRLRLGFAGSAFLLVALSVHWIFINVRDLGLNQYLRDINADDSFYYLKIAKNLTEGHFSTFDGQSRTNGHHPLWTLILAGLHMTGTDALQVLRIAKATEFLLLASSAFAILMSAYRMRSLPFLWCWSLFSFLNEPNLYLGMEAAVQLTLLSTILLILTSYCRHTRQKPVMWAFALLLALVPWARLETVAFALAVASLTFAERRRTEPFSAAVPLIAVLGSLALYFLLNRLLFDGYLPVSGELKNFYSRLLWSVEGGRPDLFTRVKSQLAIGPATQGLIWSAVGAVAVALTQFGRKPPSTADRAFNAVVLGLIAAHVARLGYSTIFVHPRYAQYGWYFVPAFLLEALTVPLFAHRLLQLPLPHVPAKGKFLLTCTLAGLVAAIAQPLHPYRLRHSWLRSTELEWERASHAGAEWLDEHLPDGSVIGSEDAGVIGYFTRHRVINLDGLVNSTAFARALETGRHREALKAASVTHIANVMIRDKGCYTFAKTRDARTWSHELKLLHEGPVTSDGRLTFRACEYR